MNRKSKNRITTNGEKCFSSDNPFASLDSKNFSDGSDVPVVKPSVPQAEKKFRGRVEVRIEKSGRGGKQVTALREFPKHITLEDLGAITFSLKKTFACGGSLKDRTIELQGDFRETVMNELKKLGFSPVRSGG